MSSFAVFQRIWNYLSCIHTVLVSQTLYSVIFDQKKKHVHGRQGLNRGLQTKDADADIAVPFDIRGCCQLHAYLSAFECFRESLCLSDDRYCKCKKLCAQNHNFPHAIDNGNKASASTLSIPEHYHPILGKKSSLGNLDRDGDAVNGKR